MCHQITVLTYNQAMAVVEAMKAYSPAVVEPDWPVIWGPVAGDGSGKDAFPGSLSPVIITRDKLDLTLLPTAGADAITSPSIHAEGNPDADGRTDTPMVLDMTWGFNAPWKKSGEKIFNTRIETALDPNGFWRDALDTSRCIVPVQAFFESHRSEQALSPRSGKAIKQIYRFRNAYAPVCLLAGIFQKNRFSLITTEPNGLMRPIHDRMPWALSLAQADVWLGKDYGSLLTCDGDPCLPKVTVDLEADPILEPWDESAAGSRGGNTPSLF